MTPETPRSQGTWEEAVLGVVNEGTLSLSFPLGSTQALRFSSGTAGSSGRMTEGRS